LRDNPNSWLPEGTIMIIKEPYLQFWLYEDSVNIRCDSPSDVIFVDEENQELLKGTNWLKSSGLSFDQLKAKGNQAFSSKDYHKSLKFYDRALKIHPDHPIILLNKSASFLSLERYYEAYEAASKALKLPVQK
jgi:tetratricopeptide (TPR) repeat protein